MWGNRYLLNVEETDCAPRVEFRHYRLALHIHLGADVAARQAVFDAFYRSQQSQGRLDDREMGADLGGEVEPGAGSANETKWGSCATASRNIRLNTDLAKKPLECLEYIALHEMAHLLEPTHNARFVALMDAYMPNWQHQRGLLNKLPVRQDAWDH